ncbi:MAG: hypothetical protein RIC55_19180 [Pirellulaceae bacterium]
MTEASGQAVKRVDAETAELIVAALVEGLRVAATQLNWKCGQALCVLGERIFPYLASVIEDQGTSEPQRRRLRILMAEMSTARPTDENRGVLVTEAMLEAIRVGESKLNAMAVAAISRFPGVVDRLIVEAACKRKQADYCVRLLHAAGEAGQRPDVDQHLDLFTLVADENPHVQEGAARLVAQIQMLPVHRVPRPRWPGRTASSSSVESALRLV